MLWATEITSSWRPIRMTCAVHAYGTCVGDVIFWCNFWRYDLRALIFSEVIMKFILFYSTFSRLCNFKKKTNFNLMMSAALFNYFSLYYIRCNNMIHFTSYIRRGICCIAFRYISSWWLTFHFYFWINCSKSM